MIEMQQVLTARGCNDYARAVCPPLMLNDSRFPVASAVVARYDPNASGRHTDARFFGVDDGLCFLLSGLRRRVAAPRDLWTQRCACVHPAKISYLTTGGRCP